MFSSIIEDLKREYEYGNMVSRLIIINISIFALYTFIYFILYLFTQGKGSIFFNDLMNNFCFATNWREVFWKPFGIFTHFFLHFDFWHILFNMLFLHFAGSIFGDLLGDQRVLPLYILGGLAGAATLLVCKLFLPNIGPYALGASASIMAIVVAVGIKAPNYLVRLLIIGEVKLKYVVMAIILLDMIGARSFNNSGGHLAHLGGALMGYIYISNLNNGRDIASPINRILDNINSFWQRLTGKSKPKPTLAHKRKSSSTESKRKTVENKVSQDKIDLILEKIKDKGYESLSEEEKQMLFNASQTNKQE